MKREKNVFGLIQVYVRLQFACRVATKGVVTGPCCVEEKAKVPPRHKSHFLSVTPPSSSKGEGPAKIQTGQKYFSFFVLSNLNFFSLNPGYFVVLFSSERAAGAIVEQVPDQAGRLKAASPVIVVQSMGSMVAEHGLLVKVETWKYIGECISLTLPHFPWRLVVIESHRGCVNRNPTQSNTRRGACAVPRVQGALAAFSELGSPRIPSVSGRSLLI